MSELNNRLKDILQELEHIRAIGEQDRYLTGIDYDSRNVNDGFAFIAVRGFTVDGHKFIDTAIKKGATVIFCEELPGKIEKEITYITVEDTRATLARLAKIYFNSPDEKLIKIAVTGTNGKSSTVFFVQQLIEGLGEKAGLIGTIHYDLGMGNIKKASHTTPESLKLFELFHEMLVNKCKYCVMEVSSHALALNRVDNVKYQAAVFTNLSHDHLDFHKSFEDYFQAKYSLFTKHLDGIAIINEDDNYKARFNGIDHISFGSGENSDYRVKNISLTSEKTTFDLVYKNEIYKCLSPVLSKFNIWNITASIAVLSALNYKLNNIVPLLSELKSVPGRMEKIENNGITAIVDYAHSPDALEKLLESAREICIGNLILVFGCGGDRDKEKRPVMARVAEKFADKIIVSSDNPRTENPLKIINEIKLGFKSTSNIELVEDREKAINKALSLAEKSDLVIVAGKGHEDYQELNGVRHQFDDREVIRNWNGK